MINVTAHLKFWVIKSSKSFGVQKDALSILYAGPSARLKYKKHQAVDLGYQSMCLPTTPLSEGLCSHFAAHNPA